MTRAKRVIVATIFIVAIITCLAVPVVAVNSASGDSSKGVSSIFYNYSEGTCPNISSRAVTPTSVIPAIPPQVPITIIPPSNLAPTSFIDVTHKLHTITISSVGQKKNDDISLPVNASPVASPVPSPTPVNNTNSEPAGTNSQNLSQVPPVTGSATAGSGHEKQDKHWLNLDKNSVKNLTRDDPLYNSWTSHLDTPREITINTSVSQIVHNSSGISNPGTNIPGNLKQDQLDAARGTTHQQINTMSQRMGLFKAYVSNSSSLTDDDKALLLSEAENNTLWLSGKVAGIQSATDSDAAEQLMADVEARMPLMEADLQRSAGLLACNEINGRISDTLNASLTLGDRIGQMGLSDSDLALAREDLADCREHLLNASLCSDAAADAFQGIDGSGNSDSNYAEGLSLLQQSREELNRSYMAINKLFHLTVEHTNKS